LQTKHSLCHILSKAFTAEDEMAFLQPPQTGPEELLELCEGEDCVGAEEEPPPECPQEEQNFAVGARLVPHISQNLPCEELYGVGEVEVGGGAVVVE